MKSDLIAKRDDTAVVIDTQVVSEHVELALAHKYKVKKYQPLDDAVKERYSVSQALRLTVILSYRGILFLSLKIR